MHDRSRSPPYALERIAPPAFRRRRSKRTSSTRASQAAVAEHRAPSQATLSRSRSNADHRALHDLDDGIVTPPPPPSSQLKAKRPNSVAVEVHTEEKCAQQTNTSKPPQTLDELNRPKKRRKVQWSDRDQLIQSVPLPREENEGGDPVPRASEAERVVDADEDDDLPPAAAVRVGASAGSSAMESNKDKENDTDTDKNKGKDKGYLDSEIYNAIAYGDIRSYLKHKRAKLKVQEAALIQEEQELMRAGEAAELALAHGRGDGKGDIDSSSAAATAAARRSDGQKSDIFKGCCIYINGQTHPPYSELRRLIVLHGGQHMAYLDQKRPCTHIVASNLTPKKRIEFKDYKVVLPGWILESIEMGKRADWTRWKCDAVTGSNGHVGRNLVAGAGGVPADGGGGGWAELARQAREGKALPRFGEDVESLWGRPSRQKTLLQGFVRPRADSRGAPNKIEEAKQQQQREQQESFVEPQKCSEPDKHTGLASPVTLHPQPNRKVSVAGRTVTFKDAIKVQREADAQLATAQSDAEPASPRAPPGGRMESAESEVARPVEPRRDLDPETPDDGDTAEAATTSAAARAKTPPASPIRSLSPQTPVRDKGKQNIDDSIGTDLRSKATAVGLEDATTRSGYANRCSNTHAARLLASPSWRERNTATGEGFLAGYFAKSRLHHLSTWKTSLQDMVSSALRESGRQPGSVELPKGVPRIIMHIDFDSFFVSVGLLRRPELSDRPVAVCHGSGTGLPPPPPQQSSSTSEIASCNYVARRFGVRNGMSLGQAKKLCPQIQTIPYDFKTYNDISIAFYTFLLEHADALQAVSVDEALVDVSMLLDNLRHQLYPSGALYQRYRDRVCSQTQGSGKGDGDGDGDGVKVNGQAAAWSEEKQLAEAFRDEIRRLCGCEASIGIGSNILLARLATRKAKPGGSFHLTDAMRQPFLDELNVDDLHGIGWSLRDRLRDLFQTINVGEIRRIASERRLMRELGPKKGKVVWQKLHGLDADRLEGNKLRQSVGTHVNYGIRFLTNAEAEAFVDGMCHEVAQRARAVRLRGRQVSVQVMVRAKEAPQEAPKFLGHGICDTHHRSAPVAGPGGCAVDDKERIKQVAWPLICDLRADPRELRGIAISLNKLEPSDGGAAPAAPNHPPPGRTLLRFGTVSPDKAAQRIQQWLAQPKSLRSHANNYRREDRAEAEGAVGDDAAERQEDEDDGEDLPDLQQGPLAATPRRPVVAAASTAAASAQHPSQCEAYEEPKTPPHLPLGTQLAIPSASQLDPSVVSALPTPFREQIYAALGTPARLAPRTSTVNAAATPYRLTPRVLPRSTPTTPQKAKAAPDAATAERLLLPSASQLDPNVLAELPEWMQRDILRQSRAGADEALASSPSASVSLPVTPHKKVRADRTLPSLPLTPSTPKRGAIDADPRTAAAKAEEKKNHLFRSLSESPRKRTKLRLGVGSASGAGSGAGSGGAGVGERRLDESEADLASIPSAELGELGIDADVFRALPYELQRETYSYHVARRESERKRFKPGSSRGGWEEVTLAENRRRMTRRAAQLMNDGENAGGGYGVQAIPHPS
ncbi:deoxycytidyl transferase [Thecaphora frezii]